MVAMNCRENQDAIATMGGTDPLVQLCSAVIPPEVQTEAVFALTELARHNPENQSGIADTGAIRPLVMLMQKSKSPDVDTEVAGALWVLSENHEKNKVTIAASGAIPLLVELLGATSSPRAPILATNALSALALGNQDNQAEISALLVNMLLSAKVQETQEWASNAAWRMVRENPADTLGIARAGGAGPLVRLLRDTKLPSVKAYALLSLSLAIDEANQSVVAEEGGIEPLVGLLRLPDVTTCEQAAVRCSGSPSTMQTRRSR